LLTLALAVIVGENADVRARLALAVRDADAVCVATADNELDNCLSFNACADTLAMVDRVTVVLASVLPEVVCAKDDVNAASAVMILNLVPSQTTLKALPLSSKKLLSR
jgi:hypothetical protein